VAAPPFLLTTELRSQLAERRRGLIESMARRLGSFDPEHVRALVEVPRERFVRPGDVERSADDTPLPLDDDGLATISAPHAYLLSYRLLALSRGDSLVELGSGSGYGAALAAFIVGPTGTVLTLEIDEDLAAQARRNLAAQAGVTVVHGDAMASAPSWRGAHKVVATFAVGALPEAWLAALPEGGMLVLPVGPPDREQRLILATRRGGAIETTSHDVVRYVRNRSPRRST